MSADETVLETRGLSKAFGSMAVVSGVDFRLRKGARQALIGPNGAGKTTFINLLTGDLPASSGSVHLKGEDVTRLSPERRVKRGLGRTFQINTLFRGLSVLENVVLAVAEREGTGGRLFPRRAQDRATAERAFAVLDGMGIAGEANRLLRELPYGRQRLVEVAIALSLEPSVILLDEPAAGIPTGESGVILDILRRLPADISILMIEHDMNLVRSFADRVTVLVQGEILAEAPPADILADPRVREVYLGTRPHG